MQQQGVIATHPLHTNTDASGKRHMGSEGCAYSIIGPGASSLDEQAPAIVLNQAIWLRSAIWILIHAIDPGAMPERTTRFGIPQHQIRRAIPGKVIEIEAATGLLIGQNFEAHSSNRSAIGGRDAPGEVVIFAWS